MKKNRRKTTTIEENVFDSWAERNGFSHAGIALLWVLAVFVLFQVFAGLLVFVLVYVRMSGEAGALNMGEAMSMMTQHLDLVFISNTVGQVLFLALGTWVFCRLQASRNNRPAFLRFRFRDNTPAMIGIVTVLMVVVQPFIWFLGWLNSLIPVPELMESMQLQQMQMIESYLTGDGTVWVALLNIGIVPAVCEEILFRGYVLRSFEKSWGIKAAVIVSGVIFGLFHLQLANFLPLATIGILLAFMTWASRSLIPAMVAHFVNNGASVLMGKFYPDTAFSELSPDSMPSLWLVLASMVISAYLIYLLITVRHNDQPSNQGVPYDQ